MKSKQLLLTVKVTAKELEEIKAKAQKFTAGNVSAWVKYSAIELDPKPKDMQVSRIIKK
jgi:hypothetical protein